MERIYRMDVNETDTRKIVERMKEMMPFAKKNGRLDLHLPDESIVMLYPDGRISCLCRPLRFVNGQTEKRRILAREVYNSFEWE
ncbi:hypothetical protein C8D99_10885 [Aminivibrio pyruvatiphilus]|uniref:Uncharacterized protein n=1 Tax=Aminivibrio pyruvatiphilus TaxID=1005740 RepID=A0A4R8MA47_9BACT|nr:hypothetical protein [Aminivibrio pyruvatiphilus]NCB17188.1 hypothetical protein [Synergistales bacterium]TDY60536.1 hypothetical protein C8D99_10885 [Aminivibrio pyruvatiphilus]